MRLLLIRHGESSANAEGRIQGRLDIPLSDRGRRQSDALADRVCQLKIDALYTSPLSRASDTAAPLATRLRLPAEPRPDLMERDFGDLAGLTRDEIIARYPEYVRARTQGLPIEVDGYEGDDVFNQRVTQITTEIIEAHPGQTVVAVSHGGVIAAMCRQTLQMPVVRPGRFAIDNCSITTFDVREVDSTTPTRPRIQLVALNDTCHLDGLRSDTR